MKEKTDWKTPVIITSIIIGLALIVLVIVLISNSRPPIPENPPFEIKEIKWESSYYSESKSKCSIEDDYCNLIIKINVPEKIEGLANLEVGYDEEAWEFNSESWNGNIFIIPLDESIGEKRIPLLEIKPKYGESNLVLCWTTDNFKYVRGDENKAKKEYRCTTRIIKNALEN